MLDKLISYFSEWVPQNPKEDNFIWQRRFKRALQKVIKKHNLSHLTIEEEVSIDASKALFVDFLINGTTILELNGSHHFLAPTMTRKAMGKYTA